jgi:seryl-tRNA synthetase
MLDPKLLRNDLDFVVSQLQKRAFTLDTKHYQNLEGKRKAVQIETEELQNKRNVLSKEIGEVKANKKDAKSLLKQAESIGATLEDKERLLNDLNNELRNIFLGIPNILHESVPPGKSPDDNKEISTYQSSFNTPEKVSDHAELGQASKQINFDQAAKITGSRFSILQGEVAQLHRALTQYMLNTHVEKHSYKEVYVPYIVNEDSLIGTGQLPKFADDLFKLDVDQEFYLIPTAEVSITNIVRDKVLDSEDLPLKYVSHTPCFRSEAGSHGKDTRGLIRQHQFEKVEIVQIVKPSESWAVLDEIVSHAEQILKDLDLTYRTVILCSADTGFASAKTIDLETWIPSQKMYREISSCSNFLDFQSRRMMARYKSKNSNKPEYVHTLNGSGLAVGRTLVAILENFQDGDQVFIPDCLQPYMSNKKTIDLKGE